MKKPERLINGLNKAYIRYINSDIEFRYETQAALVAALKEFTSTNLIYWAAINIDEPTGNVFRVRGHEWYLAQFEGDDGLECVVPIRQMKSSYAANYYMLPCIFPTGTFTLGKLKFRLDKNGLSNLPRPKEDPLPRYVEVLSAPSSETGVFSGNFGLPMTAKLPVLKPIQPELGLYLRIGTADLHNLTSTVILAKIIPDLGCNELMKEVSDLPFAPTHETRDDTPFLEVGLITTYMASHTELRAPGVAYWHGEYYDINPEALTDRLFNLRPRTVPIESDENDNVNIYYRVNNRLTSAK